MPRLVYQAEDGGARSLELRPGLNRIGRGSFSDLFIDHGSVSAAHCEVVLDSDGLSVRDLGSTNGTFVNGRRVRFAPVQIGQIITVGSVSVAILESENRVTIPEFREPAIPPVLKTPADEDVCLHHESQLAVWKCTRCGHHLCTPCVHRIRRRGGNALFLCPDCSGPCQLLDSRKRGKFSWLGGLRAKMKIARLIGRGRKLR
jgi:hypothetical protein